MLMSMIDIRDVSVRDLVVFRLLPDYWRVSGSDYECRETRSALDNRLFYDRRSCNQVTGEVIVTGARSLWFQAYRM